jgi:hypothetical protein
VNPYKVVSGIMWLQFDSLDLFSITHGGMHNVEKIMMTRYYLMNG